MRGVAKSDFSMLGDFLRCTRQPENEENMELQFLIAFVLDLQYICACICIFSFFVVLLCFSIPCKNRLLVETPSARTSLDVSTSSEQNMELQFLIAFVLDLQYICTLIFIFVFFCRFALF